MNQNKCPQCNLLNDANMSFCTGCGSVMFSIGQAGTPTVEKRIELPTVDLNVNKPKTSVNSMWWIAGLIGCFGILGIGLLGVLGLAFFSISKSNSNQNLANSPINISNKRIENSNSNSGQTEAGDLIEILQERKEVGKFKQLQITAVNPVDYFPYAKHAVQTSYHNGSRYISVSIGKFENFDDAKKNFDEQFANVKKKGGKAQILETAADGTINGVHQVKNFFTAEYCTKSAFCYRMASNNPKALKDFLENFIKL
jgi:hypothetical protein